jgi:hypothetical protein
MKLLKHIKKSRYGWFIDGLPDVSRAQALFAVKRNTMTTSVRCRTLWDFCKEVINKGVPGDFVECGVWKGGSAGIMALALQKFGSGQDRRLHLFDSFEGLPAPREEDGVQAAEYSGGVNTGALESVHQCEAGIDIVRQFLFQTLGIPQSNVTFHQGWFQDTIPKLGEGPSKISILRLDGDWYESTKVCLEHLYDRVPAGGFIILDDYFAWEGCKKATDEFRNARGITSPLTRIDVDCAYWIKEN